MAQNQVQFSAHAVERVLGRFNGYVTYAQVQTVLQSKPLRNGMQKVIITTLDKVVRIADPDARDNGVITGRQIKAVAEVRNNSEIEIITIVLE